jgi:hypothetical protein
MPSRRVLAALFLTASIITGPALAQSAREHHVWQDARKFEPYSRTAESITGSIRLSGNKDFATPGSKMTLTFANGKKVELTSVGASWRQWDDVDDKKVTAEVFKVAKDPGKLLHGNTLCGDPNTNPARYVVFLETLSVGGGDPLLGMDVFGSKTSPHDINSDGLCGTFNYSID